MEVNILGEEYTIDIVPKSEDPKLDDTKDGYCDTSEKICVIDDMSDMKDDIDGKGNIKAYRKQVIRHEMLHAFLHESGLDVCSWAGNEEMVDWFAIQFPKIAKAYDEAGCL